MARAACLLAALVLPACAWAWSFEWCLTGHDNDSGEWKEWRGTTGSETGGVYMVTDYTGSPVAWDSHSPQWQRAYLLPLTGGVVEVHREQRGAPYISVSDLSEPVVMQEAWKYDRYISQLSITVKLTALSNAVFSAVGDFCSTVANDTRGALVVNGVELQPKSVASLPFPVYFQMTRNDALGFYDADTGAEIVPLGTYRDHDGSYCLRYSGNIRICDGSPTNRPPAEPLVFGSFKSANTNKVLYAANDMPLYADGTVAMTNVALVTWWDFTQSEWGGSPQAMINGEVVCYGHSTSHIIAYEISTDGMRVYDGVGYIDFTMSQTPQSGYPGGSCTMRCWDASMGSETSAYDRTPAAHRAEVIAGTGVAKFRVTVNIYAGTWTVEPL